jgi:hypothetical protein
MGWKTLKKANALEATKTTQKETVVVPVTVPEPLVEQEMVVAPPVLPEEPKLEVPEESPVEEVVVPVALKEQPQETASEEASESELADDTKKVSKKKKA